MNPGNRNAFRPRTQRIFSALLLATLLASLLVAAAAPAAHAQGCVPLPPYAVEADRIGMNVITDYGKAVFSYDTNRFGSGWFIDYRPSQFAGAGIDDSSVDAAALDQPLVPAAVDPVLLPLITAVHPNMHSMAYLHLLRSTDLDGDWQTLVGNVVRRNPGLLLVVGNEPDRPGLQDNDWPHEYARTYHDVYDFVKNLDPTAQIAVAGVVQPTPLRLYYLDKVLEEYQKRYGVKMPVDVWTVHAFILREIDPADAENEYENWGAGIPPGVYDRKDLAIRYDVEDHGDIQIFKQNLIQFRKWMKWRGYRDKPLIVTEFGILMRPDYPAGDDRVYDHEFVREFMVDSFDFMRTAKDAEFGYPADGNRLVQSWAWFALNNVVDEENSGCCNGNLVNHDSGSVTPLGEDFAAYTAKYGSAKEYVDLALRSVSGAPLQIPSGSAGERITVSYSLYNRGNLRAPARVSASGLATPTAAEPCLRGIQCPSSFPPVAAKSMTARSR